LKKLITGNEAVAYGALRAGVKVVTGYPGTPSTGALESLLAMELPDTHVEWSTNEKVALEIAAGVAWSGHRALCTMKMSGVNVAYDSLISIAYSGCDGGLVIYVADDPGTSAGMCEQDSRWFAMMSDMVMLEPASVSEAYQLVPFAFQLSEAVKTPVFVRLVTAIANAFAEVDVAEPAPVSKEVPVLVRDIDRYTKAGAVIGMSQHRSLIDRLDQAGKILFEKKMNQVKLARQPLGLGIIVSGAARGYLQEGLELAARYGLDREKISVLTVVATSPFPAKEVRELLEHCGEILVLEELEPHLERGVYVEAARLGYRRQVRGKLDGLFSRIGEYGVKQVVKGLEAALNLDIPADLFAGNPEAEKLAANRLITTCAGCPHRGTYLAINQAIRKLKFKKDDVMVTGDIGCTILGMNPPFETVWSEISMGASVSYAQGFVHAGVTTPVIATIGDSTFFHGGIPGLINAIHHHVNMTLIIMDNRWTGMTGMQINPGTPQAYLPGEDQEVDIAKIIPALGVKNFFMMDPFDLPGAASTVQTALQLPGPKVILARGECAIQSMRRDGPAARVRVIEENCNLCGLCVLRTACPALIRGTDRLDIDPALCTGCGLCVQICNRDALAIDTVPERQG
jgi:indolepyruvate ferredoxin oxidoreductase, alpha subunit